MDAVSDPAGATRATLRPLSLARHVRETVALALPMIAARAGLILMLTIDTLMTGWAGGNELAYLAVGIAPQVTLMLIAIGALQATAILTAQAIGAGEGWRAGAVLRAGLVLACALGVALGLLTPLSEAMFLALGQGEEVSAGAARVSAAFAFGLPGLLMYIVAGMFLEATGRPRVPMVIILVANVLNVPFNGLFVLGWGGAIEPMGAEGAVIASSILRWLAFFAAYAAILRGARRGDLFGVAVPAATWLKAIATFGGETGVRLRRLGLPMGIGQGVESSAFTALVFLAGALGATVVSAHQATMTLITLVFMTAIGFGGAAAIRVGAAVGRGSAPDVKRAGLVAVALGATAVVPLGVVFAIWPEASARLITQEAGVLAVAGPMLGLVAFFLPFDSANGVTAGALRGMGEVWVPLMTQSAAFWFVAVPVAWWLAMPAGLGAIGLMIGMSAGMVCSSAMLIARFLVVSARPPRRA